MEPLKMDNSDINLNSPVVEREVLKERLRNAEEKYSHQEESFRNAYITIGRLEAQLKQTVDDFHDMRGLWGKAVDKSIETYYYGNTSNRFYFSFEDWAVL